MKVGVCVCEDGYCAMADGCGCGVLWRLVIAANEIQSRH